MSLKSPQPCHSDAKGYLHWDSYTLLLWNLKKLRFSSTFSFLLSDHHSARRGPHGSEDAAWLQAAADRCRCRKQSHRLVIPPLTRWILPLTLRRGQWWNKVPSPGEKNTFLFWRHWGHILWFCCHFWQTGCVWREKLSEEDHWLAMFITPYTFPKELLKNAAPRRDKGQNVKWSSWKQKVPLNFDTSPRKDFTRWL